MYTKPAKKLLIMNILDILKTRTDENHTLSQADIAEILQKEYDMSVDRKTIRRNLMDLIECGYNIEYSESIRMVKNRETGEMEESTIMSDFYLEREFTDSELWLLIDSLLFSKHIPQKQCYKMIEKLEHLSSKYFQSKVKHIITVSGSSGIENKQLFYTIEVIDEAISKNKQVSFHYNSYGIDKKLHLRHNNEGKPRVYIANPYQIVAMNGYYYLICNIDKFDDVANYRLDRISDIEILDIPAKPTKKVKGMENGINLPKHMAEHIYMFSGESAPVKFRMSKGLINDVMDWFGNDIRFTDETETTVIAHVFVNLRAMRLWAIQYAVNVEILAPQELVENVRQDLRMAAEKYDVS